MVLSGGPKGPGRPGLARWRGGERGRAPPCTSRLPRGLTDENGWPVSIHLRPERNFVVQGEARPLPAGSAFAGSEQSACKGLLGSGGREDPSPVVAPVDNVVDCAGKFQAELAGHAAIISRYDSGPRRLA